MVRNIAHSLKGAAGNISAKRVHAICLFIEQTASEEAVDGIQKKLTELDSAFREYQAEAKKIKEDYHPF